MIKRATIFAFTLLLAILNIHAQYQFIDEILEFTPAPGQFINTPPWGMPESTQSIVGTINGSLSLGAWGGYVVFRFEDAVQNHPDNPFGVDFIIFGNPLQTWSEPGTVWVMKDENGNGVPDGTWYQLAGSDYHFSSTIRNYSVTYFNPGTEEASDVPWIDSEGNEGVIPANSVQTQNYYPRHDLFPHIPAGEFTFNGIRIEGSLDKTNPAFIQSYRRAFGYADNVPRGTAPFNVPNNPYTRTVENAGGDGFDISWAVDEDENFVDLDEIHFIKVQTGMLGERGWMGEISTEVTGAVVVEPNPGITGVLDMVVIKDLPPLVDQNPYPLEAYALHRGRVQPEKNILWTADIDGAYVDNEGSLHFDVSGTLTLTAYLEENSDIYDVVTTTLEYSPTNTHIVEQNPFKVYPNPASGFIHVESDGQAFVKLFDLQGRVVREFMHTGGVKRVSLSGVLPGVYLMVLNNEQKIYQTKIMVK